MRASVQPTFVRFVFEMPDGVGVSSVLNDQKLTLSFNAALSFDLADAKLAAPSNVASINQKIDGDSSAVEVALIGDVDVHSFREEKNYIVDVAFQQAEKPPALLSAADAAHAPAPAAAAATAPAPAAPAPAAPVAATPAAIAPVMPARSADAAAAPRPSGEMAPLTSEKFAKEANVEIKPEAAPKPSAAAETAKPTRLRPAKRRLPRRRRRRKSALPRPSRRLKCKAGRQRRVGRAPGATATACA